MKMNNLTETSVSARASFAQELKRHIEKGAGHQLDLFPQYEIICRGGKNLLIRRDRICVERKGVCLEYLLSRLYELREEKLPQITTETAGPGEFGEIKLLSLYKKTRSGEKVLFLAKEDKNMLERALKKGVSRWAC